MSAALIGLAGVLVGLLVASSFTFWATRRSELAASAVAASILAEELRHSNRRSPEDGSASIGRLEKAWDEHRDAFIQASIAAPLLKYVRGDRFSARLHALVQALPAT